MSKRMTTPFRTPVSAPRLGIRRQLLAALTLSATLLTPIARAHANGTTYQQCLSEVKTTFDECIESADGFMDKVGCNATGSVAFWGCTLKETVELAGPPVIYPALPRP